MKNFINKTWVLENKLLLVTSSVLVVCLATNRVLFWLLAVLIATYGGYLYLKKHPKVTSKFEIIGSFAICIFAIFGFGFISVFAEAIVNPNLSTKPNNQINQKAVIQENKLLEANKSLESEKVKLEKELAKKSVESKKLADEKKLQDEKVELQVKEKIEQENERKLKEKKEKELADSKKIAQETEVQKQLEAKKSEEISIKNQQDIEKTRQLLVEEPIIKEVPVTVSSVNTNQPPVKKSISGNKCHVLGSTYYDQTKKFISYNNIQECLDSGGVLPKR